MTSAYYIGYLCLHLVSDKFDSIFASQIVKPALEVIVWSHGKTSLSCMCVSVLGGSRQLLKVSTTFISGELKQICIYIQPQATSLENRKFEMQLHK